MHLPEANKTAVLGVPSVRLAQGSSAFLSGKVHGGESHTRLLTTPLPGSPELRPDPARWALLIPHTEEAAEAQRVARGGGELELQPRAPCFQSSCLGVEDWKVGGSGARGARLSPWSTPSWLCGIGQVS